MNSRILRTNGSIGRENLTRLAVTAAILTLTACGGGGDGGIDEDTALDLSSLQQGAASIGEETPLDLSNLQQVPPSIGAATDSSVLAEADVAEAEAGKAIVVGILNNDSIPTGTQFQLVSQPENGTAVLLDSGELQYTPDADFEGTDIVEYVLVGANGDEARGQLFIAVCADCDLDQPALAAATPSISDSGNPYCLTDDADPDGDGFGWENDESCQVPPEGGFPTTALTANTDNVTLDAGTSTAVSALRNDIIADRDTVEFSIDVEPNNGRIEAADSGVVVYTAPDNFAGTDSIVYSLTDRAGNTSVANIDFNIECDSCVTMKGLRLSWPANPASENVDSYRVFFGSDENLHTSTPMSEVDAGDFTGSAPNIVYDLSNDLGISGTEGGCFRVTAVRGSEESEASDPICFKLG